MILKERKLIKIMRRNCKRWKNWYKNYTFLINLSAKNVDFVLDVSKAWRNIQKIMLNSVWIFFRLKKMSNSEVKKQILLWYLRVILRRLSLGNKKKMLRIRLKHIGCHPVVSSKTKSVLSNALYVEIKLSKGLSMINGNSKMWSMQ